MAQAGAAQKRSRRIGGRAMTSPPPTTPPAAHGEDGSNGDAAPLAARVVLVGRTGLDAALRLDSSIELLRARNALDAIGELASPIDDTVPLDTTVIVSTDADPSPRGGGPAFINALRLVNPDVRVLLVGTGKRGDYDGVILSALVPQDSLRAMVHRSTPARSTERAPAATEPPPSSPSALPPLASAPSTEPPSATTASRVSVPTPAPSAQPRDAAPTPAAPAAPVLSAEPSSPAPTIPALTPAVEARPPVAPPPPSIDPTVPPVPPRAPAVAAAAAFADESALVEALLTGRDPLLPALDILRRRTGLPDLAYADSAIPFAPPTPPIPPTPVAGTHHQPAAAQPATASPPEFVRGSTISPPSASSVASPSHVPTGGRARITVPVVYNQRTFGYLATAGAADPAALAPQARWLANWLALREQHEQLREAAFTDDLTGAYNRRYFDRFLAAALDRARADRLSVTVLLFDIDDFKQYNDRFGHVAGDEILKETVRLLKSVIRPTDRVCRIGGDEFAVIFYEPAGPRDPASRPPTSIWDIAQRFQRQVCEHRFPKLAEQAPGTLTISGGLATYPWDGMTPAELVERADALAIESKRKGKNVITLGPGAERVCGV
jgi:diguanylate cyclase (GGDEF)-like protein